MRFSKIADFIFPFLNQPRNYARVVGVILFAIGLIGFAFRSDSSLPDIYLGGALLLGFWGIVSGLWDGGGKYAARRASDKAAAKASARRPEVVEPTSPAQFRN